MKQNHKGKKQNTIITRIMFGFVFHEKKSTVNQIRDAKHIIVKIIANTVNNP